MAQDQTVLFHSTIFGPIRSRRLGTSLGVNLMPADGKICSFDCLYCEAGFNSQGAGKAGLPSPEHTEHDLREKLRDMRGRGESLDVITFSGNGEPTLHPDFPEIIDMTLRLRDEYYPEAKVSVLTNSTRIFDPQVAEALKRVDNNILKLDTVNEDYIRSVDRPTGAYSVDSVVEQLRAFRGHAIIQTMFMRGVSADGRDVTNTGEEYVGPWLKAVEEIRPQSVMIYTIDRETPDHGLRKATHEELDAIRDRVVAAGIACTASY